MHPGLWLAFGDISGTDFWRNKGVVRHAGFVEEPVDDPQGGRFAVRNVYEFNGKTICEEVCRIRIRVTPHGNLIEWESKFSGAEAFTFGDQEEMGLGVRVATDMTVNNGGVITSSDGRKNEKQVWGRQADWCDYSGEGVGVMVMPDPQNFRRSWFHARDYGLLVANPFGRQAFTKGESSRVVVKKGETLTLRFGVLVHDGDLDRPSAYQDFVQTRRKLEKGSSVKPHDQRQSTKKLGRRGGSRRKVSGRTMNFQPFVETASHVDDLEAAGGVPPEVGDAFS